MGGAKQDRGPHASALEGSAPAQTHPLPVERRGGVLRSIRSLVCLRRRIGAFAASATGSNRLFQLLVHVSHLPAPMNAAECRQMVESARRANLLLGVAQVFRFEQSTRCLRERVAAGQVGKPVFARAEFSFSNSWSRWQVDQRRESRRAAVPSPMWEYIVWTRYVTSCRMKSYA